MTSGRAVSDIELNAYLDGELGAEERRVIEARLSEDAALAERMAQLRRINEQLRARYDPIVAEPLPASLEAALRRGRAWQRPRPWMQIAAAIVLLMIGGAGGYVLRGAALSEQIESASFVQDAVGAHAVYSVEVRHPVEVAASEEDHLVKWLTKRIGAEIRAPDLGTLDFRLMGGRLLAAEGQPAAQFMYEDKRGRRLTLYVRQADKMENTAFQFAEAGGVSAFYWIDRPLAYAIAAELPREELLAVSRLVYEQLD